MGAEGPNDGVAVFEVPSFRRCAWLPLREVVAVNQMCFFEDDNKRPLLAVCFSHCKLQVYGASWSLLGSVDVGSSILSLTHFGSMLAVGMESGFLVLRMEENNVAREVSRHLLDHEVLTLVWNTDGTALFVAGQSSATASVFSVQGECLKKLPAPANRCVQDARFSRHGTYLFVLIGDAENRNCSVNVLETVTFSVINTFACHEAPCFLIEQHPLLDEVYFTAGYDGLVKIFSCRTGRIQDLRIGEEILSAVWSHDGLGIAVGGAEVREKKVFV
jgi:WD40 repeat protein